MSDLFLSCLTTRIGEARSIGELAEVACPDNTQLRDSFTAGGLRYYRKASCSPCDLAIEVVQACVQQYGLAVDTIDTVIYSTNSFWSEALVDRINIARFMSETGLRRANPIGIHLGQCANFHWGLMNARALIQSGSARKILIVNTDGVPDFNSRIIPGGLSVASDAASCCLLSDSPPNSSAAYTLTDLALLSDSDLLNTARPSANLLLDYGSLIRRLSVRLHKQGVIPASEVSYASFNNYIQPVVNLFARFMDYKPAMVMSNTLSDIGHAHASDCVINLLHLQDNDSELQAGQLIALIGTAPASIGGVILQRV